MTAPDSAAVSASALAKHYGDVVAVAGIDLEVRRGECFGFLGPNGAGKTTTMRMIYRTAPPTSGTLTVLGLRAGPDDRAIKGLLGVVPQGDNLDEDLTVIENLLVYARFHGLPGRRARERAEELFRVVRANVRPHEEAAAEVFGGFEFNACGIGAETSLLNNANASCGAAIFVAERVFAAQGDRLCRYCACSGHHGQSYEGFFHKFSKG